MHALEWVILLAILQNLASREDHRRVPIFLTFKEDYREIFVFLTLREDLYIELERYRTMIRTENFRVDIRHLNLFAQSLTN